MVDAVRQLTIGTGLAEGDLSDSSPDGVLEGGSSGEVIGRNLRLPALEEGSDEVYDRMLIQGVDEERDVGILLEVRQCAADRKVRLQFYGDDPPRCLYVHRLARFGHRIFSESD